jgi:hypothetical protein
MFNPEPRIEEVDHFEEVPARAQADTISHSSAPMRAAVTGIAYMFAVAVITVVTNISII